MTTRFELRLASPEKLSEAEALAFIRLLGSAAAAPLGRQAVATTRMDHPVLARLLAAAAREGIRDANTAALASRLSRDPDRETRMAARDALLWSILDPDPARDAWLGFVPLVAECGLDREYPLPTMEEARTRLAKDLSAAGVDGLLLPARVQRMPALSGITGFQANLNQDGDFTERLGWLVQCARANRPTALKRLVDYLEPEPCTHLERTPSDEERQLAWKALCAVTGRTNKRYDDWVSWILKDKKPK